MNQAPRYSDDASFDARLADHVRAGRLPGASAGVIAGGELTWSGSAGFADVGGLAGAGDLTLYRIASITKTVTGTAIMRLRDGGRLGLDDPVVGYLPELRNAVSPHGPVDAITIRQLLSHESGLQFEPAGTDWSVPSYQPDPARTLARPGEIVFRLPPFTQHKYSDLAYQLLGEVVTRASGTPYHQYVTDSVLTPLGLSSTSFDPLPDALARHAATGYGWRTLSDELEPAPQMPPVPPMRAEGGLWSTVADLGRWLAFQLSAYQPGAAESPVLSPATLREMHKARYLGDDSWASAWGISWKAVRLDDVTWITHAGGLPGFTSTVCFDPVSQTGAVVLVNGTTNSTSLAFELAASAASGAAPGTASRTAAAITAPDPLPAGFRPLLGIYARPDLGGWLFKVEWRDGKLTVTVPESPGFQLTLIPTGAPEVFTLGPGSNFAGEQVRFQRGSDGEISSVLLVETTFVRLSPPPEWRGKAAASRTRPPAAGEGRAVADGSLP